MSEKKNVKKKSGLASLAGWIIPLLIGGVVGGFAAGMLLPMAGDNDALYFIYLGVLMIGLIIAWFLQIIVHEAGHLVYGLMSGYRFLSFNVFGLIWTRGQDGRLQMKRMQIAGAGGQCLMAPPEYNGGDFPFVLYNLGGVLANLLAAALCGLLAVVIPVDAVKILLVAEAIVGVAYAVMNGVPFTTEALQNDGKNIVAIRRSEYARRAFWVQMALAAETTRGTRLRSMPEEWFAAFPEEEMDNAIVCAVAVQRASRLMDQLDFTGALEAIRTLLARKKGVLGLYRMTMTCDGAVCELITGQPGELTEAIAQPEIQQMMKAMKAHPAIVRTQYAIALLSERDGEKAGKLLAAFEAAATTHAYPQETEGEREILLAIQTAMLTGGAA